MKQKAVIKVSLKNEKYRSKALTVVVAAQGIISAGWKEGDQIELVGVEVDMVKLTMSMRKKVGPTQVLEITEVKPPAPKSPPLVPPYSWPMMPAYVEIPRYDEPAPLCTIM